MKTLAPLLAATALALSGSALAELGGTGDSQSPGDSQAAPDAKKPEGFVLLQRNIYVPVDAEGKVTSNQWVVIEKQGFITAEELEAATKDAGNEGTTNDEGTSGNEEKPQAQEPTVSPLPRTSPSFKPHHGLGQGPMIIS